MFLIIDLRLILQASSQNADTLVALPHMPMAKKNIRKCNLSPAHQAVFFSFENHFHQVRYIPVTNTPPVPLERIGELKAIKKYKKQQKPP